MLTSERPKTKSFRDAGSRIFTQDVDTQPGIISLLDEQKEQLVIEKVPDVKTAIQKCGA